MQALYTQRFLKTGEGKESLSESNSYCRVLDGVSVEMFPWQDKHFAGSTVTYV